MYYSNENQNHSEVIYPMRATLGFPREFIECTGIPCMSGASSMFVLKPGSGLVPVTAQPMDPRAEALVDSLNSSRIANSIHCALFASFDSGSKRWILRTADPAELRACPEIENAYQIFCNSNSDIPPYTVMSFQGVAELLIIPVSAAEQENTLKEILNRAAPVTATMWYPFYHGWTSFSGSWYFYLKNGSTHDPVFPHAERSGSYHAPQSDPHVLVERYISYMERIQNPELRGLTVLWFHAAALSSLLSNLGFQIPVGLNLQCSNPHDFQYFKALFSWHGDSAIPLSAEPNTFAAQAMARKDQPLLLEGDNVQAVNASFLMHIMAESELPEAWGSDHPLVSLPTVLTHNSTLLNTSYRFPTIEVRTGDLVSNASGDNDTAWITDYVQLFNSFISRQLAELVCQLDSECGFCESNQAVTLSLRGARTYGILMAMRQMIAFFFRSLEPSYAMMDRMWNILPSEELPLYEAALLKAKDLTVPSI